MNKQEDVQLEVIGAGLPRTGTSSLWTALEILGYPCYHMIHTVFTHEKHSKNWIKVMTPNNKNIEQDLIHALKGYRAGVDAPVSDYYYELSKVFPNAKVILTYRSPKSWLASVNSTIMNVMDSKSLPYLVYWVPALYWQKYLCDHYITPLWMEKYGGVTEEMMDIRVEEVKRLIPAERLLIFQVQEGWEPLCKFLNVPIPNVPFPNVNNNDDIKLWIEGNVKTGIKRWIYVMSTVALGVAIGYKCLPIGALV